MGRKVQTLTILLVGLLLLVGLAWAFQGRLIYFPTRDVPPVEEGLPGGEAVSLVTGDGLELAGWFLEAPRARGGVLVCNGNAGNRAFRAPVAQALARRGYSVLLFDYRGYGGTPGTPSEAGLLADARAARAFLEGRVGEGRACLFGESLGAAVAVALAADREPRALVLRSPFTSLADVGRIHYPFFPVGLLLRDRYPSRERIRNVDCPILVVAGEEDRIVPPGQSRTLLEAAGPGDRRWVLVPGADHNDPCLLAGRDFVEAVVGFLDRVLGEGAVDREGHEDHEEGP